MGTLLLARPYSNLNSEIQRQAKVNPVPSKISPSNKGDRTMCQNPGQLRRIEEMFHQDFELNLGG